MAYEEKNFTLMSNKKKHTLRVAALTALLFLLYVWCYGYYVGRFSYRVHKQDISFYDLPADFDGYRIVQFSDMHIGTFSGGHEVEVQTIVDLINSQKPDLIVFTGDLVNRSSSELKDYRCMLAELNAPDGIYSVLGNHDYAIYKRDLTQAERQADKQQLLKLQESYGWTPLLNQNVKLSRNRSHIFLIGVENQGYWRTYFPKFADLTKAMKGTQPSDFKILLSHDPTHWRHDIVGKTNIQLTLSGHTHAGQFQLFGWSPVSWIYPDWQGTYVEKAQVLSVSTGIGCLIPFRFGALPEINVITLHRAR